MYFLRLTACSAVAFCVVCFTLFAQPEKVIQVAKQPVKIIPHGENVHVFCAQTDLDYNEKKDDGDTPASWQILSKEGNLIRKLDFAWNGTGYAAIPTLDIKNNIMYCNDMGRVRGYNAITQEVVKDTVYPRLSAGLAVNSGGNLLAITIRPNFTDPGKVVYMNLENGDTTIQLQAGINVRQPMFFEVDDENRGLLVLNEGLFNSNTSWLHIWTLTSSITKRDSILLGDTGNNMFVDGENVYVAVNGSHVVRVINIKSKQIIDSIRTETTGYNGPREVLKIGNEIFVSTFEGDVRRFSLSSKTLLEKFITNGKPEGIAHVGEKIWVADAMEKGQYTPQNTVSVWNYLLPLSVNENLGSDEYVVTPNPANEYFTAYIPKNNFELSDLSARLVSVNGTAKKILITGEKSENGLIISADTKDIVSGMYTLVLKANNKVITMPIVIVK